LRIVHPERSPSRTVDGGTHAVHRHETHAHAAVRPLRRNDGPFDPPGARGPRFSAAQDVTAGSRVLDSNAVLVLCIPNAEYETVRKIALERDTLRCRAAARDELNAVYVPFVQPAEAHVASADAA